MTIPGGRRAVGRDVLGRLVFREPRGGNQTERNHENTTLAHRWIPQSTLVETPQPPSGFRKKVCSDRSGTWMSARRTPEPPPELSAIDERTILAPVPLVLDRRGTGEMREV